MFRIQHGSWKDDTSGAEKIEAARLAGWTEVDMFQKDFDRHQEYLGQFRNIYDWVNEHVGKGAEDWYCINQSWLFRDPNKAMLFKLTWGGA